MNFYIKKIIFFVSIFLIASNLYSQKQTDPISNIKIDNLENHYIIKNNSITKLSKDSVEIYNFSDKLSCKISAIDVSEPFKILVYFSEQNKMIFLDNKLSQQGQTIFFDDFDILEISHVCKSANGGFWVIDKQNRELVKFNSKNKISFKKHIQEFNIQNINNIKEKNNILHIITKNSCIKYDEFGNFIEKINN